MVEEELFRIAAANEPMKQEVRKKLEVETVLDQNAKYLGHNPDVLAGYIMEKSREYEIDPFLILALIKTESDFRGFVVSGKGAIGLMQIKPVTASMVANEIYYPYAGAQSLKNGEVNIALGVHYFAKMIKRFNDLELALEAYNRGPSRLRKDMAKGKKLRLRYSGKVLNNYYRILDDHYYKPLYDFSNL